VYVGRRRTCASLRVDEHRLARELDALGAQAQDAVVVVPHRLGVPHLRIQRLREVAKDAGLRGRCLRAHEAPAQRACCNGAGGAAVGAAQGAQALHCINMPQEAMLQVRSLRDCTSHSFMQV